MTGLSKTVQWSCQIQWAVLLAHLTVGGRLPVWYSEKTGEQTHHCNGQHTIYTHINVQAFSKKQSYLYKEYSLIQVFPNKKNFARFSITPQNKIVVYYVSLVLKSIVFQPSDVLDLQWLVYCQWHCYYDLIKDLLTSFAVNMINWKAVSLLPVNTFIYVNNSNNTQIDL